MRRPGRGRPCFCGTAEARARRPLPPSLLLRRFIKTRAGSPQPPSKLASGSCSLCKHWSPRSGPPPRTVLPGPVPVPSGGLSPWRHSGTQPLPLPEAVMAGLSYHGNLGMLVPTLSSLPTAATGCGVCGSVQMGTLPSGHCGLGFWSEESGCGSDAPPLGGWGHSCSHTGRTAVGRKECCLRLPGLP